MRTEDKNYKVGTPEVGRILALCTDNLTKKLTFDTFWEKLAAYINKELTHATDVVCVVKHMKDPKTNFDKKNKPRTWIKRKQIHPRTRLFRIKRWSSMFIKTRLWRKTSKCFHYHLGVIYKRCAIRFKERSEFLTIRRRRGLPIYPEEYKENDSRDWKQGQQTVHATQSINVFLCDEAGIIWFK